MSGAPVRRSSLRLQHLGSRRLRTARERRGAVENGPYRNAEAFRHGRSVRIFHLHGHRLAVEQAALDSNVAALHPHDDFVAGQRPAGDRPQPDAECGGMGKEGPGSGVERVLGDECGHNVSWPALSHNDGREPCGGGARLDERVEDHRPEPRIEVVNGRLRLKQSL